MSLTCYQLLQNNINKKGFWVYYRHKIPLSKLLADVEAVAFGMQQMGLKKGDVVTLYLPSCPQSVVLFYACSKLGLVANMVHPLVPVKLLAENLQKTQSKVLFFYDATAKDEQALLACNQTLVRCSIADYVQARKPLFAAYANAIGKRLKNVATYKWLVKQKGVTEQVGQGDDVVCYMHSGGTSGSPKIVKLTNDAINGTALAIGKMYHPTVGARDVNLATLPMFHAYGLCAAVHAPLILKFNLILMPKFQPSTVAHYMRRYKVTCWSVVPAMIIKMFNCGKMKRHLKNLDVIWCGGDVLDERLVLKTDAVLQQYGSHARLMRGYGLTEVCGVCVVNNYDHYRTGSCGKAMPGCHAAILDEQGNKLPANKRGEIAINSPGLMSGYLEGDNNLLQMDDKQWILTGDVGYKDSDGFLYVVDRKKRSLKIAAVNVFPAEIEACVKQLPFVQEACAVGKRVDGKQYVKVYVTVSGNLPADEVTKRVTEICQKNLIQYSVPRFVEILSQMPRTPLGKVDFVKLQQDD